MKNRLAVRVHFICRSSILFILQCSASSVGGNESLSARFIIVRRSMNYREHSPAVLIRCRPGPPTFGYSTIFRDNIFDIYWTIDVRFARSWSFRDLKLSIDLLTNVVNLNSIATRMQSVWRVYLGSTLKTKFLRNCCMLKIYIEVESHFKLDFVLKFDLKFEFEFELKTQSSMSPDLSSSLRSNLSSPVQPKLRSSVRSKAWP